jgi:hypothetical protein
LKQKNSDNLDTFIYSNSLNLANEPVVNDAFILSTSTESALKNKNKISNLRLNMNVDENSLINNETNDVLKQKLNKKPNRNLKRLKKHKNKKLNSTALNDKSIESKTSRKKKKQLIQISID